jgi:hypothetical protein
MNDWENEDPFSDMPEEAQTTRDGKPAAAASSTTHEYAPPRLPKPDPRKTQAEIEAEANPVYEQEEEFEEEEGYAEPSEEESEDYADVLSDAHLRLEQGSLYKLIMNHNLFEGVDSDPKAIQNVQREIRKFARERMEIMLGMRQEPTARSQAEFVSPFNALEIEVLKAVASTATKGATETEEANQLPVQATRKNALKPIGGSDKRPAMPPKVGKAAVKTPLKSRPPEPVKRSKLQMTAEQIAREEGVPVELLEMNALGVGGKSIAEMTATELLERDRMIAKRRTTSVKSSTALPHPTYEQMEMIAMTQSNSGANGFFEKLKK